MQVIFGYAPFPREFCPDLESRSVIIDRYPAANSLVYHRPAESY